MKSNEARTPERENERNMQKIQQLMLGDSSSMERASERASDPDPEAAAKIVMQKKHQDAMLLEEENSSIANELTMNILNQHPKQDNLFTKEREYDQQALEAPEAGKPPLLAPLIVRPQHSESNALMRMNSCMSILHHRWARGTTMISKKVKWSRKNSRRSRQPRRVKEHSLDKLMKARQLRSASERRQREDC